MTLKVIKFGQFKKIAAAENKHLEIEKIEVAASTALERADEQLRIDVIEELVASGVAPHVAANLTNTLPKLMAKAKEINFI